MLKRAHYQPHIQENDLDPDEGNRTLCKACTFPIFSTPLYNENIDFPLHKDCANLPMLLNGHFIHPHRPLVLLKEPLPRDYVNDCWVCNEKCKGGFIYYCKDSECKAVLHLLCALPIGTVKVLHRSHRHQLVPIDAEASISCDACWLNQTGPSYFCNICRFWLHRDCALLPNRIRLKEHHSDQHILILTYGTALSPFEKCTICQKIIGVRGSYICTSCDNVAHIHCATSDPKSFSPALIEDSSLIHLPLVDEQMNLVHYLLENTVSSKSTEKEEEERPIHAKKLFEGNHEHPLVHHDHTSLSIEDDHDKKYRWCNGCIRPISLPFYHCPECSDFFLHSCCATLPLEFQPQLFKREKPVILFPKNYDDEFHFSFLCNLCGLLCNGFIYTGTKSGSISYALGHAGNLHLDVECTFLPKYITHEAHPKSHILIVPNIYVFHLVRLGRCECCGERIRGKIKYECIVCDHFQIHIHCAKLPKTVTHKFDKHPLKLTFPRSSSKLLPTTELDDERFCEICEENINTKLWYYGCDKCNNWFHINCIPSVGKLSKIKFGGTIRVPGHDCPLISIRLITEYSHRCGICQNTIEGLKDEIAFECSKCDFRVHYSCARAQFDNLKGATSADRVSYDVHH